MESSVLDSYKTKKVREAVKEADDRSIEYDLQGFIKGGGVVGRMNSVVISEIEGW